MILPITVHVAGREVARFDVEVEAPASAPDRPATHLTNRELCARWKCSSRTLARLRAERRIPFEELRAGLFRYRVADVEAYEANTRTEVVTIGLPRRPGRPRKEA